MKTFKKVTTQKISTIICDMCGLQANAESDYEFHEFISIKHHCGYSSIHGDGKHIGIDLCQQCFADMCGDNFRLEGKSNSDVEENGKSIQLEYSNIFDVIDQSEEKSHQMKEDCDLKITIRDLLSKNKVSNNHELTIALKRVKQIWDAQLHSTEGNELHHLADLICVYEKNIRIVTLNNKPLTDDD